VKFKSAPPTRKIISALLFFAFASVTHAQTVIEDIVARVNDAIITRSDLERSREQMQSELKQQSPTEATQKFSAREKDLLRDLIDQKLLLQKGKDEGITGDTAVIKKLDEIRKSMNLESMEDMEKAALAQGISFEDFKENLRTNIVTQEVISTDVGKQIKILPSEVTAYYEAHKKQMEQPEQVRLAEILVSTEPKVEAPKPADANSADAKSATPPAADAKNPSTPAPSSPAASASAAPSAEDEAARSVAAEAKAKQLLESIRKGAKFEEVAKQSSDGPTASEGGELGMFKRGSLAKELEDKTFAMKPGDVSDVIRTKQGYIILKVLEHTAAGIPSQKEVENQIYEALYYEKLQPTLRTYLTKLREEAYIDIKPGFIDSGASPNQTKPVVTSVVASADSPKGRKKKKKLGVF
jgi:peptidyl-prolyl cis-trans isomerase SurA